MANDIEDLRTLLMKTENFIIHNDNYHKLCKIVFKVLSCNALWIMNLGNSSLNMLATDHAILEHYWNKKYYLHDPNLEISPNKSKSLWEITLGTDCESFNESGFLYDLYKMFQVEEFVSIEKKLGNELYCFRFFTKSNRFIFMNKLLNNMSITKHFINTITEACKEDLYKQPGVNLVALKENKGEGKNVSR